MSTNNLCILWENTLGTLGTLGERPTKEQWAIWEALYPVDVIRKAILKTAMKNQSMNGEMSHDYRLRFASRVMMTAVQQSAEHAENREHLRQEFEGGAR